MARLLRDCVAPSYADPGWEELVLSGAGWMPEPAASASALRGVADQFAEGRFDLLGSGWTRVPPPPSGERVNRANLRASRAVRALIERPFFPIDWQLDVRSGFRWSERTWHRRIRRLPFPPGADIKVPWELGQMQHIPLLAWACVRAEDEGERGRFLRALRNHIFDFVAANPPRFGVQWASPMMVAIRAANLALGRRILGAADVPADTRFDAVLARSLREHGRFVMNNLEWTETARGNHYLANVAGMIFIAAHLPRDPETDAWLAFGTAELFTELDRQFLPDGANFEASTRYHLLASEMVAASILLIEGLPADRQAAFHDYRHALVTTGPGLRPGPLDVSALLERARPKLHRMKTFTSDITKPGGSIHQVGDNDSGRFLGTSRTYDRLTVGEARARLATLDDYAELPDDADYWLERTLDPTALLRLLDATLAGTAEPGPQAISRGTAPSKGVAERQLPPERVAYVLDLPRSGISPLTTTASAYPDFGLYILRAARYYIAIRCGGHPTGSGGHAHNDQLAIEVNVDGVDWIADPGTYVYTASPAERNRYRSAAAHFVPRVAGREPAWLDRGIFRLADEARAECLHFGAGGFVGLHHGFGSPVYRALHVGEERVTITDHAGPAVALEPVDPDRIPLFSPGYGVLERHPRVRFSAVRVSD